MRRFLLAVSFLGALLFGGAFVASYLDPLLIERGAREVVRLEVERRVGSKIDSLSNSRIAGLAQRALEKTDVNVQATQRALRADVPRQVASVVADMLRADCECRKKLAEAMHRGEVERLSSLTQARERLTSLIQTTYSAVAGSLMREFRIFTASNAVAFALLGLATLWRRAAALQLVLPAVVLLGAVAITAAVYLIGQNWLHTVVYGDYVGLAYAGYLSAVAALLADIVFNRARVTSQLLNAAFQLAGAALKAVPC